MVLRRLRKRAFSILFLTFLCGVLSLLPAVVRAQTWKWTTETIDYAGDSSSLAIDRDKNLHVSYHAALEGQLKYAFRPANSTKWYTMTLDSGIGGFSTGIAIDKNNNPGICYSPRILKFARWNGQRWLVQEISPGGGLISYTCSVIFGPDGEPRVSWYVESGTYFRYAVLKDGAWEAQTLESGGLPGKWNTMVLDSKGNPHLSYNHFPPGSQRYIYFDGKNWNRSVLDSLDTSPPGGERGMGNSIVLDRAGNPLISYYSVDSLRLARFANGKWKIETVQDLPSFGNWGWKDFRSTIVLDSHGRPHIGFESLLGLEHTWWDGQQWQTQLIVSSPGRAFFDNSLVMDSNDVLYIAYTDPVDHSLKLVTGRPAQVEQTARTSANPRDKN